MRGDIPEHRHVSQCVGHPATLEDNLKTELGLAVVLSVCGRAGGGRDMADVATHPDQQKSAKLLR